jgi:hypothetical protein
MRHCSSCVNISLAAPHRLHDVEVVQHLVEATVVWQAVKDLAHCLFGLQLASSALRDPSRLYGNNCPEASALVSVRRNCRYVGITLFSAAGRDWRGPGLLKLTTPLIEVDLAQGTWVVRLLPPGTCQAGPSAAKL